MCNVSLYMWVCVSIYVYTHKSVNCSSSQASYWIRNNLLWKAVPDLEALCYKWSVPVPHITSYKPNISTRPCAFLAMHHQSFWGATSWPPLSPDCTIADRLGPNMVLLSPNLAGCPTSWATHRMTLYFHSPVGIGVSDYFANASIQI